MSARRGHGSGPPQQRGTADTRPLKVEHRRQAAAHRKQATIFRTANPNAHRVPDHACGKVRYTSADAAHTALALIARSSEHGKRIPVRTYSCPGCDGWHLTSSPTPSSGAARRPGKPNHD
ncbi:MAG: hypothetical protein HOV83_19130 [Catenulispora sp.]|nr:hypothetical protein [Catenulispora sp.]